MSNAVYILDDHPRKKGGRKPERPVYLNDEAVVRDVVRSGNVRAFWIASNQVAVGWLMKALRESPRRRWGEFVTMKPVSPSMATLLQDRFDRVVLPLQRILPLDEIIAIHDRADRSDFCISGSVDRESDTAVLVLGDLSVLAVPLSDFARCGDGPIPDFDAFDIVDHGRTLRFGAFEAAVDAVLYERDPGYRRRLKKARAEEDRSFGASLRRLRRQRKLRLEDFGALAKTVARIERGDVTRPRRTTLQGIADLLGVAPDRIKDF
jgi:hypothetical protein